MQKPWLSLYNRGDFSVRVASAPLQQARQDQKQGIQDESQDLDQSQRVARGDYRNSGDSDFRKKKSQDDAVPRPIN